MLTFAIGLICGVFIPVKQNQWIKEKLFSVWSWIKNGPSGS